MVEVAEKTNTWVADYEKLVGGSAMGGPPWLPERRKEAIARFAELGFPTTRHEEWKYTNVAPIDKAGFAYARRNESHGLDNETVKSMLFDLGDAHTMVFVNGHFAALLSDTGRPPAGVIVDSLAACLGSSPVINEHLTKYAKFDDAAFVALNTAFIKDGAFIYLPKNAKVEKPIHIVFVGATSDGPLASHPRNLIIAGENSEATIVETHISREGDVVFTNEVTEIAVAANAHLQHYKLNRNGSTAHHVATLQVHQERDSVFYSQNITFGGKLTRNDINTYLGGENIDCTFDGLVLINDEQHVDNHTRVDHAMPHCQSHELYKAILDGKSSNCFNGKIFVHEDAQKTDAFQSNMSLLISNDAQIDTKPQLEIFADDVKCSHGATIGQLDDDAIFYLRSRGIPEASAKSLLTYAFANDVVQRVKLDVLREQLDTYLFEHLPDEAGQQSA